MLIDNARIQEIFTQEVPSPAYIDDEFALEQNLQILERAKKNDWMILRALKDFAMFSTFPLVRQYLAGVCANGLDEARLGREELGKEVQQLSVVDHYLAGGTRWPPAANREKLKSGGQGLPARPVQTGHAGRDVLCE